MTDIRRRIALATAIVALAATAACGRDSGKSAAPDDALLQDLEQARGVGLATQNGGTQVVSAIELTGTKASPERSVCLSSSLPSPALRTAMEMSVPSLACSQPGSVETS